MEGTATFVRAGKMKSTQSVAVIPTLSLAPNQS
jgi:hypothetical protein